MLSIRKPVITRALLVIALAGCSSDSGPKVIPVTGVLTYKGKPVTNAYIEFIPNHGRTSWAQTDAQGRFKVNYDRERDGAVVGTHKVYVRMRPTSAAEQEAEMTGKKVPMSKEMAEFFDKYSQDNSKIEVVIDKNSKELNLNWD